MAPLDKQEARRSGRQARKALSPEERKKADAQIFAKVKEVLQGTSLIGCYISLPEEADTYGILRYAWKQGIRTAVPKVTGSTLVFHEIGSLDDTRPGAFGVPEPVRERPVRPEDMDLMLVPLAAFDEDNHRVGYGKGYYDSILPGVRNKIGIAYAVQRTGQIETDPWDITLDEIITDIEP